MQSSLVVIIENSSLQSHSDPRSERISKYTTRLSRDFNLCAYQIFESEAGVSSTGHD
jgi:hypothetical protein